MSGFLRKARKKLDLSFLAWSGRLIKICSALLPYRAGVRLGGLIGFVIFYLLRRERKRAIDHLASVFGERGGAWARKTARDCFVHLGKAMLELMLIRPGLLPGVVEFKGLESLEGAYKQGRGVVYVTAHIGNWELMGAAVGARFPLSVVAAAIKPEKLNDLIVGLRASLGVRTILRGKPGAAKELIRVFKENRVLGILIDQDTDVEGVFVDFMGRPAWTPTAAAQMAIRFGAPVVFGYIRRDRDDRHTIYIEGPIEPVRTGNDAADIAANTAMFTKKIEESILGAPDQWVWMHRRWRRQP